MRGTQWLLLVPGCRLWSVVRLRLPWVTLWLLQTWEDEGRTGNPREGWFFAVVSLMNLTFGTACGWEMEAGDELLREEEAAEPSWSPGSSCGRMGTGLVSKSS